MNNEEVKAQDEMLFVAYRVMMNDDATCVGGGKGIPRLWPTNMARRCIFRKPLVSVDDHWTRNEINGRFDYFGEAICGTFV
jgi:hypothetical protein